ncbi:MAG: UDP-N-acetylmuramate dehydrogenase [Micromonosporaceae bacterium]|nr:UDP-N-acetylmuramate dehydrogenase [Micromonosporaceae bacterium]
MKSVPDVSAELSAYTTLRLGGPAGRLVTATNADEITKSVRECGLAGEPVLVLAGGSNVVISDAGFPGTVVLIRSRGLEVSAEDASSVTITVEAGEPWDEVVAATVAEGWSGVECLSGIPGSAGATPIQNVGAYGQEVADTISAVRVYDRQTDEVVTLDPGECRFAYRSSAFKRQDRWVILSVDFRLTRSPHSTAIRHAELAQTLGVPPGGRAPLAAVREAVLALRARKGMVLDPADPDTYSVGSFFTNPVLDAAAFEALTARAGSLPAWPGPDGTVKVSAAWLIERAGFTKGYGRVAKAGEDAAADRGVAISSKHTLALTNRGAGTTAALLDLAREIRAGVRDRFGVTLYPEPVLVGCSI